MDYTAMTTTVPTKPNAEPPSNSGPAGAASGPWADAESATPAPPTTAPSNAPNLTRALEFLERLIGSRCAEALGGAPQPLPQLSYYDDGSPLARFIRLRQPAMDEFLIIILALAPHVAPGLLDRAFQDAMPGSGDFPEIGGRRDPDSRAIVPTGQTARFLIAGRDHQAGLAAMRLLASDHWLAREGMVRLEAPAPAAPALSGRLTMPTEWIERFTLGTASDPGFSAAFPARELRTRLSWHDLVLQDETRAELDAILRWMRHERELLHGFGLGRNVRPGYRALFHGPPGTGKTLAAALIGQRSGRRVYRVDLAAVVSKYIGETQQRLDALLDRAERRDHALADDRPWILFFDECDALFGKRTAVRDAHDRYANQEVSYLLQRIEEHSGVILLATNLRSNIDESFLRRLCAVVAFASPGPAERERLWRLALPPSMPAEPGLAEAMAPLELTGGAITNAVQQAALASIARGDRVIRVADARAAAHREYRKEGRVFPDAPDTAHAEAEQRTNVPRGTRRSAR